MKLTNMKASTVLLLLSLALSCVGQPRSAFAESSRRPKFSKTNSSNLLTKPATFVGRIKDFDANNVKFQVGNTVLILPRNKYFPKRELRPEQKTAVQIFPKDFKSIKTIHLASKNKNVRKTASERKS